MRTDSRFGDLCPRCGEKIDWGWREEWRRPWKIALRPRLSARFDPDIDLSKPIPHKTRLYCSKRCADADVAEGWGYDEPPEIIEGCYNEKVDQVVDIIVKYLKDEPDRIKAEELRKRLKGDES